jgi:hypothetical protein
MKKELAKLHKESKVENMRQMKANIKNLKK